MSKFLVMTPEICEQTIKLRTEGKSQRFIADRLGVSEGSVAHFCLKEGVESPRNEGKILPQTAPGPMIIKRGKHVVRHFTPEEDQRIESLSCEGMTVTQIAKALDRPRNSTLGRIMTLARQQERVIEACA